MILRVIDQRRDGRAAAAAIRFASHGVDCLDAPEEIEAANRALALDEELAL